MLEITDHEENEIKKCLNCGTIYNLKSSMPELCWVCGCPTDEVINEI